MFELKTYRRCMDELLAPEAMVSEVLKMTEKTKPLPHVSRRLLTLTAALVLLLVLSVSAYAAGRSRFGWGGNLELRTEQTADGEESVAILHTDDLTEPVIFEDGRMLFIVNGERIDITDQASETRAYLYSYTDEEGVLHCWAVGKNSPELTHYGYAEFLYQEGEGWLGGYVARTDNNEAPWLDSAKAELGVPW